MTEQWAGNRSRKTRLWTSLDRCPSRTPPKSRNLRSSYLGWCTNCVLSNKVGVWEQVQDFRGRFHWNLGEIKAADASLGPQLSWARHKDSMPRILGIMRRWTGNLDTGILLCIRCSLEPVRPRTCPFFLYRGGIPFTAPFLYAPYRGGTRLPA